jgi:NAD(P)-dependent dehydrogenase (short-subunit alcohol dehydrogenase family)
MLTGAATIVLTEVNTHVGRRCFEAIVSPIHDADGRVTGLRGITRDVTDRQEAEERLRVSEARYRNLVEAQPDLIVRTDVADRGQVAQMFAALREAFGGLDVLVNNAGIAGPTARVEDIAPDVLERTLAVNVKSQFACAAQAVERATPRMKPSSLMRAFSGIARMHRRRPAPRCRTHRARRR